MKQRLAEVRFAIVAVLTFTVVSCGGGTVDSGGAFDATTGDVAGIYVGSENLSLTPLNQVVAVDTRRHCVTVEVSSRGILVLSSATGSNGRAQVTNDRTFRMRADAHTHFSGQCSSGMIILEGSIGRETGITGQYSSDGLICMGEPYALIGKISAQRI